MATTPRIDAIESPTTQTDILATIAGQKPYFHDTTYKDLIAPTVTASTGGTNVVRAVFYPYQTQDGGWRMRFNMYVIFTSATSVNLAINGVVFKALANYGQAVHCSTGSVSAYPTVAQTTQNGNTIELAFAVSRNQAGVSGDVELNAKPTWAY